MKPLIGVHHVTAITSDAKRIYEFYTYVLGMRLVKKTINQDDINTYHLYLADDVGSPGTVMTFFDFKHIQAAQKGSDAFTKTSFRVPSDAALLYYKKRFEKYDIEHGDITTLFGKQVLFFNDFDKQEYFLISDTLDAGVGSGISWKKGPVPNEFAITGLGPVYTRSSDLQTLSNVLTNLLTFKKVDQAADLHLFETGDGGNGASIIVEHITNYSPSRQGYGGIHHVAFRVVDKHHLAQWRDHYNTHNIRHSNLIDRFYFRSLYARLYPGLLFELATDGPGFIDEVEHYDILGETLSLPQAFEQHRALIETTLEGFDTVRSTKDFPKEYL